jgi:hypothetical protein
MHKNNFPKQTEINQFAQHVDQLRQQLVTMQADLSAELFSRNTGSQLHVNASETGVFELTLWNQSVIVTYPDWVARDAVNQATLSITTQGLLLYYFLTADGIQPGQKWISFRELPNGRFYNQAYQGYTGAELTRTFKNDLDHLDRSVARLGGVQPGVNSQILGDRVYMFQALPHLAMLVVYWCGDEDFPPSAQILFENTAPHYLPTDVCAYLGSSLTRKLIG